MQHHCRLLPASLPLLQLMSSSEVEGVVLAAHSLLAVLAMPFVPPAAVVVPEGEAPLPGVRPALPCCSTQQAPGSELAS